MNVVVIQHQPNGKKYTYEVPFGVFLQKGDRVIVENARGRNEGVCLTNSHSVDKETLSIICEISGAELPLAKVVGRYAIERF